MLGLLDINQFTPEVLIRGASFRPLGPLLLIWFNFKPNMNK